MRDGHLHLLFPVPMHGQGVNAERIVDEWWVGDHLANDGGRAGHIVFLRGAEELFSEVECGDSWNSDPRDHLKGGREDGCRFVKLDSFFVRIGSGGLLRKGKHGAEPP